MGRIRRILPFLQLGKAPVALQYDFTQSWVDPSGRRTQISRLHTASMNSSVQWSRKTSSGFNYTYRRADVVGPAPCPIERVRGRWRWHLLLRTGDAARLSRVISYVTQRAPVKAPVRLVIDRDPVALL